MGRRGRGIKLPRARAFRKAESYLSRGQSRVEARPAAPSPSPYVWAASDRVNYWRGWAPPGNHHEGRGGCEPPLQFSYYSFDGNLVSGFNLKAEFRPHFRNSQKVRINQVY
jgi:hypothetical protein